MKILFLAATFLSFANTVTAAEFKCTGNVSSREGANAKITWISKTLNPHYNESKTLEDYTVFEDSKIIIQSVADGPAFLLQAFRKSEDGKSQILYLDSTATGMYVKETNMHFQPLAGSSEAAIDIHCSR